MKIHLRIYILWDSLSEFGIYKINSLINKLMSDKMPDVATKVKLSYQFWETRTTVHLSNILKVMRKKVARRLLPIIFMKSVTSVKKKSFFVRAKKKTSWDTHPISYVMLHFFLYEKLNVMNWMQMISNKFKKKWKEVATNPTI